MTNEQLTQEIISLKEHQAKSDAERENMIVIMEELRADVKSTKKIAEEVHIMAISMQNMQRTQERMQKAQEETNKKVDALTSKEFMEYKERKKLIKDKVIVAVVSSLATFTIGLFMWLIKVYILKGG